MLENITPVLEGTGCYLRRDESIRTVVPEYGEGYKCKIALPDLMATDSFAVFSIIVQSPTGETKKVRLPLNAYLGILAASNFKQRIRKMIEYYHAEHTNYAVSGTPNRLEYEFGFFVKGGDGSADFKPIAHLYKTQVYQLAEYLNIPEEIQRRPPYDGHLFACRNHRKNFIFQCRSRKWISAFTEKITIWRPPTCAPARIHAGASRKGVFDHRLKTQSSALFASSSGSLSRSR